MTPPDWPDQLSDPNLRQQAQALHRLCRLLYPQARLSFDVTALPGPEGQPEAVRFRRNAPLPALADGATRLEAGPSDATEHVHVTAGLVAAVAADAPEITRTSPAFSAPLRIATFRAPVMMEQIKHLVEARTQRLQATRHRQTTLPAAAPLPDTTALGLKPPALLIGMHWFEHGGAEALAFDCVHWALAAGLRVLVMGDRPAPQHLLHRLPDHPALEVLRPDAYLPDRHWGLFLQRLVASENIVALHLHHHGRLYAHLGRLKRAFPTLHVVDSSHIIEHSNGGFTRISGVWSEHIDTHHVISRALATYLRDQFGAGDRVRLGRMLPDTRDADLPPMRLHVGQRSLRLAFVGRMVHQKRAPLVVALMARLHRWARTEGISLHLDMLGTGAYLDVVRAMIARHGLSEMVTLHPPDADVPALLGQSDLLLLPSANEGLALVGYEALRAGALPISTDVGAQSELVPRALLLPAAPFASLRAARALIPRLLNEPGLAKACHAEVRANYRALQADPTAKEVLRDLYADFATRTARPEPAPHSAQLTAVVVTYNRDEKLAHVLDALAAQRRRPDRVIVVDNASTDGTASLLAARAEGDPTLTVLRLPENIGGAGGFNAGIRAAYDGGADLVWISDDDAYPDPDAIDRLETALNDHDRATGLQAPFACSAVRWTDGALCEMNTPVTVWDWPRHDPDTLPVHLVRACSFVSVLVPRWAIREHGLPIRDFFIWYDDAEYTLRLARSHPGLFVQSSRVTHDMPSNQGVNYGAVTAQTLWKFRYGARNEAAVQLRDRGLPGLAAFAHRVRGQMRAGRVPRKLRWQIWRALWRGVWFRPKIDRVEDEV